MGTHPIFESDFDCLTDRVRNAAQNGDEEESGAVKVKQD